MPSVGDRVSNASPTLGSRIAEHGQDVGAPSRPFAGLEALHAHADAGAGFGRVRKGDQAPRPHRVEQLVINPGLADLKAAAFVETCRKAAHEPHDRWRWRRGLGGDRGQSSRARPVNDLIEQRQTNAAPLVTRITLIAVRELTHVEAEYPERIVRQVASAAAKVAPIVWPPYAVLRPQLRVMAPKLNLPDVAITIEGQNGRRPQVGDPRLEDIPVTVTVHRHSTNIGQRHRPIGYRRLARRHAACLHGILESRAMAAIGTRQDLGQTGVPPRPDTTSTPQVRMSNLDNGDQSAVSQPRRPLQKRSRERFEKLLDAADDLLSVRDINTVGIHDIAERAGVPPASAYHFFPTREAVFVALADRYLAKLSTVSRQPVVPDEPQRWQDLFRTSNRRTIDFYNEHPVFMKLFFSNSVIADVRRRDVEYIQRLSEMSYEWMNRYFHMPHLPNSTRQFSVIIAIFEGLCLASYARYGRVTGEYAEEVTHVIIAYGRTFLPEHLPRRTPSTERTG